MPTCCCSLGSFVLKYSKRIGKMAIRIFIIVASSVRTYSQPAARYRPQVILSTPQVTADGSVLAVRKAAKSDRSRNIGNKLNSIFKPFETRFHNPE